MELFTATGKQKKFFLTTRDVRRVHHGWHGTHRYDIQVLATHTSTWVHRYSSLLSWSVPLGQRGHVAMVGRIFCTKCTLHRNHGLTHVMFQHTKRLLHWSGHFLTSWVLYLNLFLISVWYVRTGSNLCSMMTWIFYPKLYLYIVDTCLYLLMKIVYIYIWWQFPHLYDLWNMNKWMNIHSHRLAAEMWTTMKNNLLGKNVWVVPSVCTGFVNTCPMVFL